jgi:hypothetical protein
MGSAQEVTYVRASDTELVKNELAVLDIGSTSDIPQVCHLELACNATFRDIFLQKEVHYIQRNTNNI